MYTLGGGVQVPVAQHWAADLGYRYSRIAADTALHLRKSLGDLGCFALAEIEHVAEQRKPAIG